MESAFIPPKNRPGKISGFTLLEILVAVSVLALLVLFVTQLTNSTSIVVTNSSKHLDADSQARMVFDRMGYDFAKMFCNSNVDCIFSKNAQNDAMFFYSEAPAYYSEAERSAKCGLSLVGYRINTNNTFHPGNAVLERLSKGLTWDGNASANGRGGPMFLSYRAGSAPDPASTIAGNWSSTVGTAENGFSDGSDTDYTVLSADVYRMEIVFYLTDGSFSTKPVANPSATLNKLDATGPPSVTDDLGRGYAPGSRWFDSTNGAAYYCVTPTTGAAVWRRLGLRDVSAIGVGLAILDSTSRKIVSDGSRMVGALADPAPDDLLQNPPKLMAKTWLEAVTSFQTGAIPEAAARQIRIYQRLFYLPK